MNIGLLVPQIYYDLIARIVPGLTILATSYLLWKGENITGQDFPRILSWFTSKDTPAMFVLFSFLTIAYILALVLDGIGRYLEHIRPLSKHFIHKDYEAIKADTVSDFNKIVFLREDYKFPGIALMYDFIRMKQPELGARLVKLRAEFHMCRILIVGWLLLLAKNSWDLISRHS